MRKLIALMLLRFSLIVFVTLLLSPVLTRHVYASVKTFSDNFNDGDSNGWIVTRNPCLYNGVSAEWKVVSGQLGIKINGGGCVTEIMPNDTLWNSLGDDYIIDFDMNLVSGTDHNFAFRYTDPDHWYDFHIQSPGSLIMQRMSVPSGGSNTIFGDFSNGQTIHFKIIVQGDHIKLYRGTSSQVLLYDNPNMGGFFPTGRIALQASAGSDPASETYFDNIVVTSIDTLDVPYYSQNADPWGPTEYDDAKLLGFSNTTMNRWGCAVTSAAMVLNYHGMTKFADDTSINPGSLNEWLKSHKGYITGTSKTDGSYSYINWNKVASLSGELFEASKSAVKLNYKVKRATPSAEITQLLDDDLNVRKFPDILWVKNASTSSHFVVAKGKVGNTYAINDPEWNVSYLSSFGNTYYQVGRYVPSHTNFSYIVLVINPSTQILVTDSFGRKTGKDGLGGEFNEIPDATYGFEDSISNPDDLGNQQQLGTGVNALYLPEPSYGDYTINLSSALNNDYALNVVTFENDGKDKISSFSGNIIPATEHSYSLHYSQVNPAEINRVVSFQSTIDDVNEQRSLNLITTDPLARQVIRFVQQAQGYAQAGNNGSALRKLVHIEQILNRERGNKILEEAYRVLMNDVTSLKASLTH